MVYKLGLVRGDVVVAVLGGDGLLHAHSEQTRTLVTPERIGDRMQGVGSVVRVPDKLEDPQGDESVFDGVELALLQEVTNDVTGEKSNKPVKAFGDAQQLAAVAAAVARQG